MKNKIQIGLLLSATILLGACGEVKQAEQTEQLESTEAISDDKDGVVSLTLWGAEEDAELLEQMVNSFEQKYAGQADFDITITAESESTCKDTLLENLENGADVFAFVDDQLMTLVAAGALAPVPDADAVKVENAEGAVEAASVNDVLYAYPMTADNGYFMYYNKKYFSEEDVKSLDNMLAIAAENGKKVAMDWSSGWYLYSFFGATGLQVGLNDDGISNYCTWNATDNAIKGVDVASAMLAIGANQGFGNMVDADFVAGVQDGSVIAGVSGVWNATELEKVWGVDYAATKLPTYTCAGEQVQMSSFAGYKMLGVNAYSEHVEWALKLAAWITSEENQTLRFEQRGQGPANVKAASSDAVENSPAIMALLEQSDYASLQRVGGNYWDPVSELGTTLATGDTGGKNLQALLDETVEAVTASNGQ